MAAGLFSSGGEMDEFGSKYVNYRLVPQKNAFEVWDVS